MITCHDIGRHIGCYGVSSVRTPNLDKLAQEGCRFSNYFSTAPTCSPSRGSIFTGRYPQANGLMGLTHQPWGWSLNDGEKHLAVILNEAGYETNLVGFQHVTSGDPHRLGYQNVFPRNIDAVKRLVSRAEMSDWPLYIQVGFTQVHRPFNDLEPYDEYGVYIPHYLQDTPEIRHDLARFQALIRSFDAEVGEILACLQASEIAQDTLVIFTSDHGIPYIGAKWTLYDPGIETPLIMYCPGTEMSGGKVFNQLMSNVDFLPTLLDILGIGIPGNVQGRSFARVISGYTGEIRQQVFAQHTSHALRDNLSRCIRTRGYKLIRNFEPGRRILFPTDAVPQRVADHVERPKRDGKRPVVQLFDLESDPHERNDIASDPQYADVLKELSDQLWSWMEDVEDPLLEGPLVTPYYREAMEDYRRFRLEKG